MPPIYFQEQFFYVKVLPKEGKDQGRSAQTWSGNRMLLWYQMEVFKAIMGRLIRVKRDSTLSERHRAAGYCGCTEVLAKLPNIFLGLEKSSLSFKLSNLFLGSSQGCANALLHPNPFPGSPGVSCPYPIQSFLQIFPG